MLSLLRELLKGSALLELSVKEAKSAWEDQHDEKMIQPDKFYIYDVDIDNPGINDIIEGPFNTVIELDNFAKRKWGNDWSHNPNNHLTYRQGKYLLPRSKKRSSPRA